jgi:AcrR family transcriptional regulator
MPAIVDHDKRRREVAATVAAIISTRGLEAVTVRSVAKASGYSTTIVSHYFHNKRELFLFSYRMASQRTYARLMAASAKSADGDIAKTLEVALPFNAEARSDWLVWFAFWGLALADPEFSREQQFQFRKTRHILRRLLVASPAHRRLNPSQLSDVARRIAAAMIGVAVEASFDPKDWPPARQRSYISEAVAIPKTNGRSKNRGR